MESAKPDSSPEQGKVLRGWQAACKECSWRGIDRYYDPSSPNADLLDIINYDTCHNEGQGHNIDTFKPETSQGHSVIVNPVSKIE